MTRPTFTQSLKPGYLIRPKKELRTQIVPPSEGHRVVTLKLSEQDYLLALTDVSFEEIGQNYIHALYRYQMFALYQEKIVSFTCVGIDDKLMNDAFEIVKTSDPNA